MPTDLPDDDLPELPLVVARSHAVQRLQVGLFGLGLMILLVGLANIIMNRANQTEAGTVPEAAATVAPPDAPTQASDPLADAGVVPDVGEPQAQPTVASDAPDPRRN